MFFQQILFQVDPTPYKLPTPTPFPTLDATPFLQLPVDIAGDVADGAIQSWNLFADATGGVSSQFALGWLIQAFILFSLITMGVMYVYKLLVKWFVEWSETKIDSWQ